MRGFQGSAAVGDVMNFRWVNGTHWAGTATDLSPYAGTYWLVGMEGGDSLLLPQTIGQPAYTVHFGALGAVISPTDYLDAVPFQVGLVGAVLACQSLQADRLFAVSQSGWDWLMQVRVGGGAVQAFNSVPVATTLSMAGNCDAESCEGCRDLATHRLCLAYSKCALVQCVGTPVNQKRPLCGMGGLLRTLGDVAMTGLEAAWNVFAEMLALTVKLSVRKVAGVDIAWPEDQFTGAMCTAKDASANYFSVLTSAINAALQLGQANVRYMYMGASNVDTNADAMLTQTMTAINRFLNQIALAPLYAMAATYQVMMCQVNGVLSIVDASGFTVRLQSAELSSGADAIAGQCLTAGDSTLARYPNGNAAGLGGVLSKTLNNAMHQFLIQSIEPFVHYMDAGLAYFQVSFFWGGGGVFQPRLIGVGRGSYTSSVCWSCPSRSACATRRTTT